MKKNRKLYKWYAIKYFVLFSKLQVEIGKKYSHKIHNT